MRSSSRSCRWVSKIESSPSVTRKSHATASMRTGDARTSSSFPLRARLHRPGMADRVVAVDEPLQAFVHGAEDLGKVDASGLSGPRRRRARASEIPFRAGTGARVLISLGRVCNGTKAFDELLVAVGLVKGDELDPAGIHERMVPSMDFLIRPLRRPIADLDAAAGSSVGLSGAMRAVKNRIQRLLHIVFCDFHFNITAVPTKL